MGVDITSICATPFSRYCWNETEAVDAGGSTSVGSGGVVGGNSTTSGAPGIISAVGMTWGGLMALWMGIALVVGAGGALIW